MPAQQRDIRIVDVDGVNRSQIMTEDSLAFEELGWRAARDRNALINLGLLFRQVDVQRRVSLARPLRHDPHRRWVDSSHTVNRSSNTHAIPTREPIHSRRPPVGIAV